MYYACLEPCDENLLTCSIAIFVLKLQFGSDGALQVIKIYQLINEFGELERK